jgi:hypothetical protein
MATKIRARGDRRKQLVDEISRLADRAIFGSLSETFRTCGNPGCRCHGQGPKHGPHVYVSYRGDAGKTASYYVPKAAEDAIREGVLAWQQLQQHLRELAELNKERTLARAKKKVTP